MLSVFLMAAACSFPRNASAALSYLDNINVGNPVENTSINVATPAKVAIGFDIITPQDGSWSFTIRVFNPDVVAVNLQLVNNDTTGTFFTDQPGTTSPFSLGSPVSTGTGADRYTVVASGNGSLSAGRYWLVGSTTGAGNSWDWLNGNSSYDVNGGSPDDATFFGVRLAPGGTVWNSSAGNTLSLRVDVTPVPEPAQTGLIAALFLVACSLTHLVRRKRASSKLPAVVS